MKWQSVLFVILLIAAIVIVVSIGESYAPQANPYSSKDDGDRGSLAFYLLLQEYTTVERVETALKNLEPGTLLMVGPVQAPSAAEMKYLSSWLEQGNRVVVLSDDPQVMQKFGVTLSAAEKSYAVIPPLKDHWSTQNVKELTILYTRYFTSHTGEVLFADGDNPVIVEVKKGKGELFLIGTTSLAWNGNIMNSDNEIFLVNVSLSDTVYFDEYHLYQLKRELGFNLESFKTLFTGYTPFFVQLLAALALFMVAYGKRFGVARRVTPPEVQSSELVISAADLYYRAKKEEVLEILEEQDK